MESWSQSESSKTIILSVTSLYLQLLVVLRKENLNQRKSKQKYQHSRLVYMQCVTDFAAVSASSPANEASRMSGKSKGIFNIQVHTSGKSKGTFNIQVHTRIYQP